MKVKFLIVSVTLGLTALVGASSAMAQNLTRGFNNGPTSDSPFTLDYYAKRGSPIGGVIEYANAQGELCQQGDVVISIRNPTYEFRGTQYPLHGDAQNNAANLFCRMKGLDFATIVDKAEGPKVLTLEAHGNTFEVDGHHTTVTKVECTARVNEPCKSFNKDMLRSTSFNR